MGSISAGLGTSCNCKDIVLASFAIAPAIQFSSGNARQLPNHVADQDREHQS